MIDEAQIPNKTPHAEELTWQAVFSTLRFLRSKDGCSWDRVQSMESIIDALVEEVSELIDSIHTYSRDDNEKTRAELIEEFGDVNLVLIMMMIIFEEKHRKSITQIYTELRKKLIRRHPHVFSPQTENTKSAKSTDQSYASLYEQWHSIKYHVEGKREPTNLEEYKPYLHILERTRELQKKAEKLNAEQLNKPPRSYAEKYRQLAAITATLQDADSKLPEDDNLPRSHELHESIGACFFHLVDISRSLGISPSTALSTYVSQFLQSHPEP